MPDQPAGIVYLVGGGPGDPDLITVKGLNCLRRADVVLYDRLAPRALLDEAPPHAELIDVGKAPRRARRSQAEINALLIEHTRLGRTVVRLKGGDPFVFGRGGEECQALAGAGIPFEVVPGITSAVAVPAYAGIPVTQRSLNTAFSVVTGHSRGPDSGIDWAAVSRSGTLVFLMGVEHLPEIVARLLEHGRTAATPAALIENCTTPDQFVVTGTLHDIVQRGRGVQPPAVLVVGEVVRLRQQIDWFGAAQTRAAGLARMEELSA
jgi:uroporphyrin-III C-methyltransferase